jgi:hypothetical protein
VHDRSKSPRALPEVVGFGFLAMLAILLQGHVRGILPLPRSCSGLTKNALLRAGIAAKLFGLAYMGATLYDPTRVYLGSCLPKPELFVSSLSMVRQARDSLRSGGLVYEDT